MDTRHAISHAHNRFRTKTAELIRPPWPNIRPPDIRPSGLVARRISGIRYPAKQLSVSSLEVNPHRSRFSIIIANYDFKKELDVLIKDTTLMSRIP